MIKNSKLLQKFEKKLIKKERIDIAKNFQIADAMYNEAVALGVIPMRNPLSGLEIDLKIARAVNRVQGTHRKDSKRVE